MKSYGPRTVVYPFGGEEWWVGDYLHRVDGPAVTDFNGVQMWYHYGLRHRIEGPAVIFPDGREEWWINGQKCHTRRSYPQLCPLCRSPYTDVLQAVINDVVCVICWDHLSDTKLYPCEHQCLCHECLDRIRGNYTSI